MFDIKATLIRWASKTIHIDTDYLVRGSFWQSLGLLTGTLAGIATSIAFANILPKETYGTYSYVLSLFGLLSITALSGMDTAIVQSVARGFEGSVITSMWSRIRWGFIGMVISVGIGIYEWINGNIGLSYALFLAAGFVPFLDSFAIFYDVLKGRKRFDTDAKFSIIVQTINAGATILALFITKNILSILAIYFLSYTLCHIFLLRRLMKNYPLNRNEDPKMIGYGKFMTIIRGITSISAYIDKIILFHFVGAAEVAVYSLAIAPITKISGLLGTIPSLALPRFSERGKDLVKKELMGKVMKFSLVVGGIILLYALFSKFIFLLLFPKYLESVFYSRLYSLALVGFPLSLVYTYFQAHMLAKIILPYKIIIHTIQILLLFVCIYFYGILGAVIARITGQVIGIPLILFFFKKS